MMKKFLIPFVGIALLSSCSAVKKSSTTSNFDDAYFVPSDIDKSEVYGKLNPSMFQPRATATADNIRTTRSYSQSYNDRFRNFGGSTMNPSFRPSVAVTPFGTSMGFSPYGYNPYMYGMNPYGGYGYDPYMMGYGYNPYYGYNSYYNPGWCYWNQYYSPYNYNYWGSNSTGGNSGMGSSWGGNKNNATGYASSGQRRRTYNTALPSSSQSSRTGSGSGSSWTGSNSSGSDTYYRPSSSNNTSSSPSTYSRPSSSGPSQSTGGGQSGSSGRRR